MSRSPLLPIFLTVFVDVLGLTLMLPLLPLYAKHFGATDLLATTLMATYSACQLVAAPALGWVSDRVGRKPVLLVSQLGTLSGFLLIGGANGLAMLFAGRVIDGLTAGNLGIAQAYISDVTKPENRTRAFALIGIAFGIGFLIGPGVSGLLAHHYGFAAPAYAAAALSATSILFTITLLPGKEELEKIKAEHGAAPAGASVPPTAARTLALGRFFARPLPRRRLLQFFAFTSSFAVLTGGLALYLERKFGFGVRQTGYIFTVAGLVGALVQGGLIGRLVKRLGEARLALLGFITMAASYPLLGVVTSVPLLLVLVVVSSFGVAVIRPCLTTLLTKSVDRSEQGAALGTNQSLSSIAQITGQETAGFCIGHGMLIAYGLAAGVLSMIGLMLTMSPEPAADEAVGPA
jgi:MFS family permease